MAIAQHRPRQEQTTNHWQTEIVSPRPTTISDRLSQPLIFSIDDRLSEQHLTKLDLCSKNLKKIDKLPNNISFNVVLLDHNDITKVEHLDTLTHLIQLSISHNRLIDIRLLSRIHTLQKLNLSNNSLDSIDHLKTLQNLIVLNISGNNIQNLSALNSCHSLQSLDASDNSIRQIEDLSHLTSLKYLNFHRNLIENLTLIPKYWPKSIHTLLISDNEIKDLTEISYLSSLINLNILTIHDNPCLFIINDRYGCHQPFDYRPYVLNWCLSIHKLDELPIIRKESLKAEWLLSQGKGRSFRSGEHHELVQYLIKVCGTDADERDDLHLSRIMFQQDLYSNEDLLQTSDTLKDANDLSSKFQQSLLISESEFVKISPTSPIHEILSNRTPSPGYIHDDHSSINRYNNYDNRPIKPLDQNTFQTKLNQYPIDDNNKKQIITHRYSPKATSRIPTTSAIIRPKSTKNPIKQNEKIHAKRHTIAADNANTHHLMTRATLIEKTKSKSHDEEEELQLKSAPVNSILPTESMELKKLTTSIETIRTSVLQAYLNLHERFTKTTELQTSALAALWKMFEKQKLTYEENTKEILEENRLLNQRIKDLESHLNIPKYNLYPPLRVHISKRDTKSFFLHWIPNPLNEQYTILGYRIYINNILKLTINSGIFETIIDCICEEGDYKIKLRTYDQYNESNDSNIVVARFRRQNSNLFEIKTNQQIQFDENLINLSKDEIKLENKQIISSESNQQENLLTPDKNKKLSQSPITSNSSDNSRNCKPPKSPNSSPNSNEKQTINDFSTKIQSINDSSKRIGIMSRFSKSPHKIKRNNVLLNALPINSTEVKSVDQPITFQLESNDNINQLHLLAQEFPIALNSMTIASSSSSPLQIPPRSKSSLD